MVNNYEGFRPEWYISTTYHSWDTPFWSGTLNLQMCTKKKSRGPRTLPCGTPDCMVPNVDSLPFAQTYCDLSDRYDLMKGMTEWLFKYTLIFGCRIVWSTKSKAFLKSKNTAPTSSERSIAESYISHIQRERKRERRGGGGGHIKL